MTFKGRNSSPFLMSQRGQTSVEMLVIMAIGVVILSTFVGFASQQLQLVQEQKAVKTAEVSLQRIVDAANDVYAQGKGATRNVEITWPDGIDSNYTSISDKTILVKVYGRFIYATTLPTVVGSLPTSSGYHILRIRAFDGFVTIGDVSLAATPSSVFSPMNRDENSGHTIVFHNAGADANLVFTTDWNYDDIDVNINHASGSIASGSNYSLDVNFSAGPMATGSYTGKLRVQGTFANKVETLIVPLTAAVSLNNQTDLTVYPSSVDISTYQSDTNSTQIQVCNTSGVALKNISFIPSSGDAGDWVQGISSIDEIAALSCTPVDLIVTPSTSTAIGSYSGSLYLTDFSGENTFVLPIDVTVSGMNGIFLWDWSTAVKSINGITDFTLNNLGTVPIGIDQILISDWWTCDSQDSNLTIMKLNNATVFSGSSVDGNWIDVTDFNIPVLSSVSNNLLNFGGIISDENESFTAQVNFTDGTTYVSSPYGNNCIDTTPPATVNDLVATSGPDAQSVLLSFTYPGDDGNTGIVRSVDLRYSTSSTLNGESSFASANSYPYTGPFELGGTPGQILVSDLNVGYKYYFAMKFYDKNGNASGLSNNPVARPWNLFKYSLNDFNFANMPYSVALVSTGDVNEFKMENVRVDAGTPNNVVIRIVSDSNRAHGWTSQFDFNATHLTRIRIWYPTPDDHIPSTAAQYDQNKNTLIGTFNLLGTGFINSAYRYNGSSVNMGFPNYFRVIQAQNMLDFNFTVDKEDAFVVGGGLGP